MLRPPSSRLVSRCLPVDRKANFDFNSRMASDRYGIMDKLKRLQEGEDLDELLAEMDEEMPARSRNADRVGSDSESDREDIGLSALQAKKAR